MNNKTRILVVDDDALMCKSITRHLTMLGYTVDYYTDPLIASHDFYNKQFDLIITDYKMPGLNGIDLIKIFKKFYTQSEAILVTGVTDFSIAVSAVNEGVVYKFVTKPFESELLETYIKDAITNIKRNEMYHRFKHWSFSTLGTNDHDDVVLALQQNAIEGLMMLMKAKDEELYEHSLRIARICKVFAKYIGYPSDDISNLYHAAVLHDIGKLAIKDQILDKDGKLDVNEFNEIKKHPVVGADLLTKLGVEEPIRTYVYQHHEWVNGKGYPNGLKNDEIRTASKIIGIVDAYDAMRTKRAYKNAFEEHEVIRILREMAGKTFDEGLTNRFIQMLDEIVF